MMKKLRIVALTAIMLVMVAGCAPGTVVTDTSTSTSSPNGQVNVPGVSIQVYAPGPNPLSGTADGNGLAAGLGLGLWHGVISPITLVISFFNNDVQMYEVHNDGNQYNLGFLVGVAVVFGILGLTAGSRRRV